MTTMRVRGYMTAMKARGCMATAHQTAETYVDPTVTFSFSKIPAVRNPRKPAIPTHPPKMATTRRGTL